MGSEDDSSYFMKEKKLNFNNDSNDSYIDSPSYRTNISKSIGQTTFVKILPQRNLDMVKNISKMTGEEKQEFTSPVMMSIKELAASNYNNKNVSSKPDARSRFLTADYEVNSDEYDSQFNDDIESVTLTKVGSFDRKYFNKQQTGVSSAYSSKFD